MNKQTLHISMNGYLVGHLHKTTDGGVSYEYETAWLDQSAARPISLSLPLNPKTFKGDVVYNFFDNLLPDNLQVRARIQSKFQAATSQPFDLLQAIGRDCVGALQFSEDSNTFDRKIQASPVTNNEIANILTSYRTAPLGMLDPEDDFRISIAGAQEKTGLLWHNQQWNRPHGSTPTSHIFKLPIGRLENQNLDLSDSCENEWLCAQVAKAFGFEVADMHIQTFDSVKALIVERFDRRWSSDNTWLMRLPQEDFCQALGISPNLKYESDGGPGIDLGMKLLSSSENSKQDRIAFFKIQILFFMLGAIDGHAKNFSLFLKADNRYCLTPLYDILSAYPLIQNGQLQAKKIKMAMGLISKNKHYHWFNIQRRHFVSTAKATGLSEQLANDCLDEMKQKTPEVISFVTGQLPSNFPSQVSDPIFEGLKLTAAKL